jgi:hypothetical protein
VGSSNLRTWGCQMTHPPFHKRQTRTLHASTLNKDITTTQCDSGINETAIYFPDFPKSHCWNLGVRSSTTPVALISFMVNRCPGLLCTTNDTPSFVERKTYHFTYIRRSSLTLIPDCLTNHEFCIDHSFSAFSNDIYIKEN